MHGRLQRGGQTGIKEFLLFVIIPPRVCRTTFGGDKKQPEKVERVLEPLPINSEAT